MSKADYSNWKYELFLAFVGTLLLFSAFQMLLPTLPLYIAKLGGKQWAVGAMLAIFTFSSLASRVFCGKFMDEYGRWGAFYFGIVIFVISTLGYEWFAYISIIFAIRLIQGIGWGCLGTSNSTIATDIIPKEHFGKGMGIFGLSISLGLAIGPYVGLWAMEVGEFKLVAYLSSALCLLCALIFLLLKIKRKEPLFYKFSQNRAKIDIKNLIEKKSLFPSALIFFITLSYGAIVTFIVLYANANGIKNVGMFFIVFAITLLVVRPVSGVIIDRSGFFLVPFAMVFLIISSAMLLFLKSFALLIACAFFYGVGFGVLHLSLQSMAVLLAPPNRKGVANATFFTGFDGGIGVGAVVGGVVATKFGYEMMFLLFLIINIAIFIYMSFNKKRFLKIVF